MATYCQNSTLAMQVVKWFMRLRAREQLRSKTALSPSSAWSTRMLPRGAPCATRVRNCECSTRQSKRSWVSWSLGTQLVRSIQSRTVRGMGARSTGSNLSRWFPNNIWSKQSPCKTGSILRQLMMWPAMVYATSHSPAQSSSSTTLTWRSNRPGPGPIQKHYTTQQQQGI